MRKTIEKHIEKMSKGKSTPHEIAFGFAIGVFIALLPTPGFNLLLGLLTTVFFSRINKIALFGAILLLNPFVQIPLYATSYAIGNVLLESVPTAAYKLELHNIAFHFTKRYIVGNIVLAFVLAPLSYTFIRSWFILFPKNPKH